MIEMRWLVPVEGERVLQYRQKTDTTIRAGITPGTGAGVWDANSIARTANWQWSEWKTVPLESERDPAYP